MIKIPFNDLNRTAGAERTAMLAAVQRVLDRGWFILGPEVKAFEEAFAAYCGAARCLTMGNGTDALEIALRALGIGPGAEVATVANAGGYSTTAIRAVGATPRFIDIEPDSMNMSPASLAGSLRTRPVHAIIATHLYGRMVNMPALLEVAAGVPLIEDCAQAHGASLPGRRAGAWGVLACFSFYPTKNLGACGDGGAIVTSDSALADRIQRLRQYGWTAKYRSAEYGRNSRLDEMQAAILTTRLPLLDAANRRRREIAARYNDALSGSDITAPRLAGEAWVAHLYVVRTSDRDAFRAALGERGIATEIHYPIPDHLQPAAGENPPTLPETERAAREILTLPCYPELREDELDYIVATLRSLSVRSMA